MEDHPFLKFKNIKRNNNIFSMVLKLDGERRP